ncbi:MAG: tetratricopeptide repeat protein [Bacteriovoracaceae bacterium]|nr:tetratricopeptide repeat protein [Bacteriovoracaceae bacterium]
MNLRYPILLFTFIFSTLLWALPQKEKSAVKELESLVATAKSSGPQAIRFLADDFFLKATRASLEEENDLAILLYRYVLKLVPHDLFVQNRYILELIKVGNIENAKKELQQIYQNSITQSVVQDEKISLMLGSVHTALEEKKSAKAIYEQMLKRNPHQEIACFFLSQLHEEDKKFREALATLDKCMRGTASTNGNLFFQRGKILLQMKDYSQAIVAFRNSLNIDPEFFRSALALGAIFEEQKKYDEAIKTYKKYLKKDAENTSVLTKLLENLFVQNRYNESIPVLEQLVDLDPADLNMKMRLALLYMSERKLEQAKMILHEILNVVPAEDKVLYYLGNIYEQTGNRSKAITQYEQIAKESELYPDVIFQLGKIYSDKAIQGNKKDEDIFLNFIHQHVSQSQKIQEAELELIILQANYLEKKNDIEKAIALLEQASVNEYFIDSHKYYLASLYEKKKDFFKSSSLIHKILQNNPQHAHSWNFLAYSLLEQNKDLEKAYFYLQKAVALAPQDGFILDSLGWYFYKKGNLQKSLTYLRKAYILAPKDNAIARHLAIVYKSLYHFPLARKHFQEALENSQAEEEKKEVAEALKGLDLLEKRQNIHSQQRRPASH